MKTYFNFDLDFAMLLMLFLCFLKCSKRFIENYIDLIELMGPSVIYYGFKDYSHAV